MKDVVESAAGHNIPQPVPIYGLSQLKSAKSDIHMGAHGYTMEEKQKKWGACYQSHRMFGLPVNTLTLKDK